MEERRLRTDDSPQSYLFEQLNATAFQIQPYHWPTIGWMEDIKRFTLEDLQRYHAIYYNPANAFLVVAGDFRKEELIQQIERAFGSIPGGRLAKTKTRNNPSLAKEGLSRKESRTDSIPCDGISCAQLAGT